MFTCSNRHFASLLVSVSLASVCFTGIAKAADPLSPPLVHKIESANDRLEMTINSSRLLTLDQKIPRIAVANPKVADVTPLSPNVVQIVAKTVGITQVNLFGEHNQIYSIDVVVITDPRELNLLLQSQFPHAVIRVQPSGQQSVILSGFVPEADQVTQIVEVAKDYYPNVINAMKVGGVQEVLLHVKVFEVSRTKLRQLGFDFAHANGNSFAASSVSGLFDASKATSGGAIASGGANDLATAILFASESSAAAGIRPFLACSMRCENTVLPKSLLNRRWSR